MNIYIAGPMRGRHLYGLHDFAAAAWALRSKGHTVFNPLERDLAMADPLEPHQDLEDQEFDLTAAMTADIHYISSLECDAVAVLPGWQGSVGALLEVKVAQICGKEVFSFIPSIGLDVIEPDLQVVARVDSQPEDAKMGS